MDENEIVLRRSRPQLMVNAVISGLLAVFSFINAFMHREKADGLWLIVLGGVVALVAFIYYTKEWRNHKIEMVISKEGIRLRAEGFYEWSSIESFSTDVDESDVTLMLKIRNQASVRFGIASLEIRKKN